MSGLLAARCGGEKAPASQAIKIGFFGALTGPQATFALSGKNGALLAAEQINRAGGVLGKRLDILVEDDHNEASEAASAAISGSSTTRTSSRASARSCSSSSVRGAT